MTWQAYVSTRGPLNDGLRLEYLFARLSAHIGQAAGNAEAKVGDFLRFHQTDDDSGPVADIGEAAKLMGVKRVEKNGK